MRTIALFALLAVPCSAFLHGGAAGAALGLRSPAARLGAHRPLRTRQLVAPRAQAEVVGALGEVVSALLLAADVAADVPVDAAGVVEMAPFVPSVGGYSSYSLYATLGL